MTICNVISFGYFKHPNITMYQAVLPWLAASFVFMLVTLVPAIHTSELLNGRILSWLGSISYSIYMLHPFAIGAALLFAGDQLFAPVSLALTLLFSIAGFYLIERPGQLLGRALIASRWRTAPASSA